MNRYRVLIVDDEPLARERLEALLKRESGIEVIGRCGDGHEAVDAILTGKPDIVFLDIEMPGCGGLQVVSELPPEQRPAIVFVTAHDRFAVDAFAVNAIDYLLKPFDADRMRTALKRAAEAVGNRHRSDSRQTEEPSPEAKRPEKTPDRLSFKCDGKVVFIRPAEILRLEAADNYVVLHLSGGSRLTVRDTLSALESLLGSTDFVRINRSSIVPIDEIKELEPTFHGDYTVVLRSGLRLPLSRSHRGRLDQLISPEG